MRRIPVDARPTCHVCFRPQRLCYCGYVPRIETKTRVVIVQHPREEFHSLGTARLVEQSLVKSEVVRGNLAQLNAKVPACLAKTGRTFLVFPSADAIDISDLRAIDAPDTLVVVDGTWPQAKVLLREIPALSALPKVRFTPENPSEYRIRRPPDRHCLSTLESVAEVISGLEPDVDVAPLRLLFRRYIDENIGARAPGSGASRRKVRSARAPLFPSAVLQSQAGALIFYSPKSRMHCAAKRSVLGVMMRSGRAEPLVLDSLAELSAHLAQDIVPVCWAKGPLDELAELGYSGPRLCLKEAFCNHWQRGRGRYGGPPWGGIEDALRREHLERPQGDLDESRLWGSVLLWSALVELTQRRSVLE